MPKLIIDWSVLAHLNWHKMRAKDYIPEHPLEIAEFAKNITEHVFYLTKRFPSDDIVFAVDDSTNWRHGIYDAHYKKAIDFYKSQTEACSWYAIVDKITYKVQKNLSMEKWFVDKLSTKDAKELPFENRDLFIPLIGGELPEDIKASLPEGTATDARSHPDWEGLQLVVPTYKGNRKGTAWNYETPKDEWKVLVKNLAKNMAHVMGARYIDVANAEGDDIIAVYCLENREENIVMVTIDSDLQQLKIPCKNLQIYNPTKNTFANKTVDAIQMDLICKILGGDSADNIPGVDLHGKLPFAKVAWNPDGSIKSGKSTVNWVRGQLAIHGATNFAGVYDALLNQEIKKRGADSIFGLANKATLNKNLSLVFLANIPEDIKADIRLQLDTVITGKHELNPKTNKPYAIGDFMVTNARLLVKEREATEDRTALWATDVDPITPTPEMM